MRLILIRHGEAHAGFHGPIAGPRGCRGLTDHGRRQAEALRDHLASSGWMHGDVLLTSVLPRAIETAEIIAPGLGLHIEQRDCDLCEVHVGAADGLDWAEYDERFGSFDMEAEPDRPFAPGGDSWNGFHDRVEATFERLAHQHPDETVVVVCHAGVIVASLRRLLDIAHPGTGAQMRPSNTGVTEWTHDPATRRWTLHTFNDSSHLLPMEPASEPVFSVASARVAGEEGELREWVRSFLASPGSDNAPLGDALADRDGPWVGPVRVPLDRLARLAGPADAPVLEVVDEDDWRDDVDDLAARIAAGLEPAPVVATMRDRQLVVEDGNHRIEALRRAGHRDAWVVVNLELDDAPMADAGRPDR